MKNRLLPLILAFLAVTSVNAQKCGTYYGSYEEQEQKFPDFYQSLQAINADLEANYKSALSKMTHLKTENGKKIIPVVVHVIHNGGGENLSVSQIQNGLDHLNANINGQADNFLSITPDIFASVRGDLNVEFRLAKLAPVDPNCDTCTAEPTNGIVRVRSELTNATVTATLSRDRVKALSYWNSFQYLNIWVVKSMPAGPDPDADPALNGYAQFPFSGRMSTDGVMIRATVFAAGETITHEIGHWLGLCHTWACGAETCGTDNVADTPQDSEGTFDFNGTFPFNVDACETNPNGPAGEMYMNYMDYQSDAVQSMFTKGQDVVMNETLDGIYDADAGTSSLGFREYMWSTENIALTGVADGFISPFCVDIADFSSSTGVYSKCLGENIVLKGNKTQFPVGSVSTITWNYGDGNIDDSNTNQVFHTYESAGTYDVTLTIEYNEITEARASSLSDLDLLTATSYDSIVEVLNMQGTETELLAMNALNIDLHLDLDSLSKESIWKYKIPLDSAIEAHSSLGFGLDTFLLTFNVNYGDSLKVEEYDRLSFCFFTWEENIILDSDTVTYYYGNYESEAVDAYFMDTLFYRGEIMKTTYIAYYTNSCSSTTVKENVIKISPSSSSNITGSYIYDFEDASELTTDWEITKSIPEGDWSFNTIENSSWEWVNGVSVSGSAGLMINKNDLTPGTDGLTSVAYDLSDLTSPAIKFSYSGAASNNFPVNVVNVYYSDDCGEAWRTLGSLTNLQVANAGLYTNNFKPNDNEWNEAIMLDANGANALKNDNIKFKFEYVTNGNSNNFYLDNIMIGEEAELMMVENTAASRVSIYPNPTDGKTFIKLNNLKNIDIEVKLVNILGAELMNLFDGKIESIYHSINDIDLSHLETGIYFVKVVANGDIIATEKLILNK